ncbi:MAG: hypothetical protein ACI91T_000075 [Natronomonas sp.]
MNDAPPIPRLRDAPTDRLLTGHLWLQEWVDGRPCRFRLRDSGVLEVGDGHRRFDPGDVPPPYRATVRHLREELDRGALRDAVEDVEAVAFLGVATVRERVDYDWDRVPPFLGYDVWLAAEGRFLPPDRVEAIYEGLGLTPINAVRKEVRATDFDPEDSPFPESKWYDGPVAGIVVRNKTGDRGLISNPVVVGGEDREVDAAGDDGTSPDSEALAREVTTDRRIDRARERIETSGGQASPEAVVERLLEGIHREEGHRVDRLADENRRAFRTAVAAAVRRSFADEE